MGLFLLAWVVLSAGVVQGQEAVPVTTSAGQGESPYYVVKAGDTLSQIALESGVGLQEIVEVNGIENKNKIVVGQELVLPGVTVATVPPAAVVETPTEVVATPEETFTGEFYVVKSGDVLSVIAKMMAMSVDELVTMNHIENRHMIYVGQRIYRTQQPAPVVETETDTETDAETDVETETEVETDGDLVVTSLPLNYEVQAGDSLDKIAAGFGVSVDDLVAYNEISWPKYIVAGEMIQIPPGVSEKNEGRYYYTIQPGDQLWEIALATGNSLNSLGDANQIENVNKIYMGQRLWIPQVGN